MVLKFQKTCCIIIQPNLLRPKKYNATSGRVPEAELKECIGLAHSIKLKVLASKIFNLKDVRAATYFGIGTVKNIRLLIDSNSQKQNIAKSVQKQKIHVVVVNSNISPIQQRNLEREWNIKVIDRTGLILEIFGSRAKTREGKLQVDLASNTYQRSRLVRSWTHLERQKGGAGFMGGPGETQIETDRRLINKKINRLKNDLKLVDKTRNLHRKSRSSVPFPIIALVGYTNAGKSTLFNWLTGSNEKAENQLFATLDPKMRRLSLPSGSSVILSDTVGFISNLPHELIKAFQATLEEVVEADIIFHVRDVSHHDSESQRQDVIEVLDQLGINNNKEKLIIEVLNKIDLLDSSHRNKLFNLSLRSNTPSFPISALNGQGVKILTKAIDQHILSTSETISIKLNYQNTDQIAWLYKHGKVTSRKDNGSIINLTVCLNQVNANRFRQKQKPR